GPTSVDERYAGSATPALLLIGPAVEPLSRITKAEEAPAPQRGSLTIFRESFLAVRVSAISGASLKETAHLGFAGGSPARVWRHGRAGSSGWGRGRSRRLRGCD